MWDNREPTDLAKRAGRRFVVRIEIRLWLRSTCDGILVLGPRFLLRRLSAAGVSHFCSVRASESEALQDNGGR